jgi:hypothetical protein
MTRFLAGISMVGASFLGGFLAVSLSGNTKAAAKPEAAAFDTIEVRVLKIVDTQGVTRAWLGMEEGEPLLVMQTAGEKPRLVLGTDPDGAGLALIGTFEKEKSPIVIAGDDGKVIWKAP